MPDMRRAVAITGVGDSAWVGKREQEAGTWMFNARLAASSALDDAGLAPADIDGVMCWGENHFTLGPRRALDVAEMLGIDETSCTMSLAVGGASPCESMWMGRQAIATGRCRNVLLVNGGGFDPEAEQAVDGGRLGGFLATIPHHSRSYEQPFGPMITSYYAACALRHMHEYGTTNEQLAAVSVALRAWACLNPDATFRDPITIDDVLNSRIICDPFHLLDCGGGVRGAGGDAVILSSAEQAADTKKPPVWILGMGLAHSAYFAGSLARGGDGFGLTRTVGARMAEMAFGEAGVTPADVDTLHVHDNFTYTVMVNVEDFGFCEKGEGGPFVADGKLGPGGSLPTNTDGGHLNHGGTLLARQVEAVRQVRGECGERQVPDCHIAFTASSAGVASTYSGAVLARD